MATLNEDPRYAEIQAAQELATSQSQATTSDLLAQNTALTTSQNQTLDEQQAIQEQAIDASTEAAIKEYENQIAKSETGYKSEAGAAYADYQQLINPYGVQAETQAASGLLGSKVSETSRISAHNTYQERVATARTAFEEANTEFQTSMAEARQSGDLQKAQIAYDIYTQKSANALREFEYASQLRLTQEQNLLDIANTYYTQGQDLQSQINYENETEYQKQQDLIAQQQWEQEYAQSQSQWEKEYALEQAQLAEDARQANMYYASKQEEEESTDLGGTDTTALSSGNMNYSTLDKQLTALINQTSGFSPNVQSSMAQALIKKSYTSGSISYDEAVALAEKYGL